MTHACQEGNSLILLIAAYSKSAGTADNHKATQAASELSSVSCWVTSASSACVLQLLALRPPNLPAPRERTKAGVRYV